jgi:uncharacterized protein YqgQ
LGRPYWRESTPHGKWLGQIQLMHCEVNNLYEIEIIEQ